MNILSISGISPVPGYKRINDFVFEFYDFHLKEFKHDHVYFILPVKYSNCLIVKLLGDNPNVLKLNKLKKYHGLYENAIIMRYEKDSACI